MVEVILVGGLAERYGEKHVLEINTSKPLSELLREFAKRFPDAFEPSGEPKPGIIVFIDGVDARLMDPGQEVSPSSRIHIIQVYHGG